MEIGKIFKPKEPATPPELFLAIQIQEGLIKTAVWQVKQGHPEVTSFGSVQEWSDTESLVVAVDSSLTTALESQQSEPDRVIFGLPESWVKDDKINPDFSPHLKELISKLELKPIGFTVITEAIIQQLKLQEGIPPSAVLLELHTTKVNVVVTKLGEVIGKEEVGRSQDLAKDVQEGLARMEIEQLPARIIIINGQDPDAEQQLTSFSWQEHLSFLHLPKVETPDPEFSVKAVALSGGSEAARSLGIEVENSEAKEPASKKDPDPEPELEVASSDDLGFVVDQDIRQLDPEPKAATPPTTTTKKGAAFSPALLFAKAKDSFASLRRPKPSIQGFDFKKPIYFIIPAVLLLLLLATIFAFGRFSSAHITLFVETKKIDKNFDLAIANTPQDDLPTLPATTETLELEVSGSASTTGESLVGEKATGEVSIFNLTESEKTFDTGTILVTTDNHKFTLSENVTVASASSETNADLQTITTPGKASGQATASVIGAESNIDSDVELVIGTFPKSSVIAKAAQDFSGGTSRTVKAVSKKDQQDLLEKLSNEINQKAQNELSSSDEYEVVPQEIDIIKESFSDDVGDEADSLTLDLKASANFLRFQKSSLNDLVEVQLNTDIPTGFILDTNNTDISVSTPAADEDTGLVTTTATVKASLVPDIPTSDYQRQLKGKSVSAANSLLENIAGYQKLTIAITPNLPLFSSHLPNNPDKITFEIKPVNP